MNAVEEILNGLIVVFCAAGMVIGTVCVGWLLIDSVASRITHKKNVK